MAGNAHPIKHAGMTAAFAAAVLGIVANLLTSGFTVDVVNGAVDSLTNLDPKDPQVYFTVGTVFLATAPLVLGALASVVLLVEGRKHGSLGYSHLFGLIAIWLLVGHASASFIPHATAQQLPASSGNPFVLLTRAVVWAAQPYGALLAAQGILLGLIAAGSFYLYQDRAEKA